MPKSLDLTKILAETRRATQVEQSAIVAFSGVADTLKKISKQLADALTNQDDGAVQTAQTQLDTVASDLSTQTQALAAAIVENTSADSGAANGGIVQQDGTAAAGSDDPPRGAGAPVG